MAERERKLIAAKSRKAESEPFENVSALSLPDTDLRVKPSQSASPSAPDEVPAKVLAVFVDGESVDSVTLSPDGESPPAAKPSNPFRCASLSVRFSGPKKTISVVLDRTNLLPEHEEHVSDSGIYHIDAETSVNLVKARRVKNQVLHDVFLRTFDE